MSALAIDRICGFCAILLAGLCGVLPFILYATDVLPW